MVNRKLKALRAEYGIIQKEMARILDVSVQTYNRKELGIKDFTVPESKIIMKYFQKDFEYIFFLDNVDLIVIKCKRR